MRQRMVCHPTLSQKLMLNLFQLHSRMKTMPGMLRKMPRGAENRLRLLGEQPSTWPSVGLLHQRGEGLAWAQTHRHIHWTTLHKEPPSAGPLTLEAGGANNQGLLKGIRPSSTQLGGAWGQGHTSLGHSWWLAECRLVV